MHGTCWSAVILLVKSVFIHLYVMLQPVNHICEGGIFFFNISPLFRQAFVCGTFYITNTSNLPGMGEKLGVTENYCVTRANTKMSVSRNIF